MLPYNGYTKKERAAKGRARVKEAIRRGGFRGPCAMCADPQAPKYWAHSEDYAYPYNWDEPAVYVLCDRCHRRLHLRFGRNEARWRAYLRFIDLGWFGREVESWQVRALVSGNSDAFLAPKRTNPRAQTDAWWRALTTDSRCNTIYWPKPRESARLNSELR